MTDACKHARLDAVVGAHIETKEQIQLALQMLTSVADGKPGLRRLWFSYSAPAEHRPRFDMLLSLKLQRLKPEFDWKVMGADGRYSQFENIHRAIEAMACDPPDGILTGDADDLWGPTRASRVHTCLQQGILSSGCEVALLIEHVALVSHSGPATLLNSTQLKQKLANCAEGVDSPQAVNELLRLKKMHIKGWREGETEHYEWVYAYEWLHKQLADMDLSDVYTDMRLVQAAIYAHMPHQRMISFADTDSTWSYFWRPSCNAVVPSHLSTIGTATRVPERIVAHFKTILAAMQRANAKPERRWADYDPESALVHALSTMYRQTNMRLALPRWNTAKRTSSDLLAIVCQNSHSHQTLVNGELRVLPTGLLMAFCCAKDFREFDSVTDDEWSAFVRSVDRSDYAGFTKKSAELLAQRMHF